MPSYRHGPECVFFNAVISGTTFSSLPAKDYQDGHETEESKTAKEEKKEWGKKKNTLITNMGITETKALRNPARVFLILLTHILLATSF